MVKKRDRPLNIESKIESFASGADLSVKSTMESKAVFKRTTFSLTDALNKKIDNIVLIPRTFRLSRSEVIKAAVMHLSELSDDEVVDILSKYKNQ